MPGGHIKDDHQFCETSGWSLEVSRTLGPWTFSQQAMGDSSLKRWRFITTIFITKNCHGAALCKDVIYAGAI